MVFSSQDGEHIPGAKAPFLGQLNVRDKSRTYLRSKSKNPGSKSKNPLAKPYI